MDATFEELGRRYVDEVTAFSPVSATMLGDHRYDERLDEVSAAGRERRAEFYRGILAELEPIDRGRLSRANRIDAALLEHRLTGGLWHLEVRPGTESFRLLAHPHADLVGGLVAPEVHNHV